jgi:hypothetical protein
MRAFPRADVSILVDAALIRRRYGGRMTDDRQDRLLGFLRDLARDDPHAAERLLRHFLGMAPAARGDAPQATNGPTRWPRSRPRVDRCAAGRLPRHDHGEHAPLDHPSQTAAVNHIGERDRGTAESMRELDAGTPPALPAPASALRDTSSSLHAWFTLREAT